MPEIIDLLTPAGRPWEPVGRLVLDGVADRLGLTVEDADELKLAVEWLQGEARASDGQVRWCFELEERRLVLEVRGLEEGDVLEALRRPEPEPGRLSLRRVLDTVVDSFSVEPASGGGVAVRLEKRVPAAPSTGDGSDGSAL